MLQRYPPALPALLLLDSHPESGQAMMETRFELLQAAGEPSQLDSFWAAISNAFTNAFAASASKGGLVRDALTQAYPRLQLLLEATLERAVRDSDAPAVAPAVLPQHRDAVLRALAPLQEAYMSGCLARLEGAVSAAFPMQARAVPAPAALQQCIRCVSCFQPCWRCLRVLEGRVLEEVILRVDSGL